MYPASGSHPSHYASNPIGFKKILNTMFLSASGNATDII
jgi:hypothetical protein